MDKPTTKDLMKQVLANCKQEDIYRTEEHDGLYHLFVFKGNAYMGKKIAQYILMLQNSAKK